MLRKLINAVKSQVQRLEVQKELLQEMQSARIRAGIKTFHTVFDTIHGVEILVCNDTVLITKIKLQKQEAERQMFLCKPRK